MKKILTQTMVMEVTFESESSSGSDYSCYYHHDGGDNINNAGVVPVAALDELKEKYNKYQIVTYLPTFFLIYTNIK